MRRPGGLYNRHNAHWGALHLRLKHELTPATPFGGEDVDSEWARKLFEQLIEGASDADLEGYLAEEDPPATTIDPVPRVRALTLEELITEQLDFLHHEAFYAVDSDFEVTTYRTLWFGLQYDAETVDEVESIGNGALRTVRGDDGKPVGDGYVQGKFRGLKAIVADLVDRGVFNHDEGIEYMKPKLCEWAGDREELIIRTPVDTAPDGKCRHATVEGGSRSSQTQVPESPFSTINERLRGYGQLERTLHQPTVRTPIGATRNLAGGRTRTPRELLQLEPNRGRIDV